MHRISRFALLLVGAPLLAFAQARASTVPIVEYRHAPTNKYFLTSSVAEQSLLDGLGSIGWARTGVTHSAWSDATATGARPVCRYFVPSVGSHFMSIDPAECALVDAQPGFVREGTAWYAAAPVAGACPAGTVGLYRTFNNGHLHPANGQSNHRYFTDYTYYLEFGQRGYALEGLVMCLPTSEQEKRADAARLLFQATFGARPGDIEQVLALGVGRWLDRQLAAPASRYTPREWWPQARPDTCVNNNTPPATPTSHCQRDNYTMFQPQREFFQQAVNNADDQLRQRVAWAWSQFFVVSAVDVNMPYGMVDYQQMLRDHAFSNFRTLLERVTLHAAMGRMLDMVNNLKPSGSAEPNENYARELLQLFSIGLIELHPDGTPRRNARGETIEAYTQEDVEHLAHVFTGWTYPTLPGRSPAAINRQVNLIGEMEERAAEHFAGEVTVLGQRIAAGLSQSQRLSRALDIIFNHPNVAPFVSRALIQKLVTGDPSPAYVGRVARVFENNGTGVRGDMRSVVRAILTDIEARGAFKWSPTYGHQAEPVLLLTRLARAMGARSDGVALRTMTGSSGQTVFAAPSVFNYYAPDHALPGSGVTAPEFGIYNAASAMNRVNTAYSFVYGTFNPDPTVYGATGTTFDLSPYTSLAADPARLVDQVDELLTGARLTTSAKRTIERAVGALPASDALGRARMALYLVAASPAGQTLR